MNPLTWPKKHQWALVLSAFLGAFCGLLFGYCFFEVSGGPENGVHFWYWVREPAYQELWFGWPIAGAMIGALSVYIRHLLAN